MKPTAVVITSHKFFYKYLVESLISGDIEVVDVDKASNSSIDYIFTLLSSKQDIEALQKLNSSGAKVVIAIPVFLKDIYDKHSFDFPRLKEVYFYELLAPEVDHSFGYANWLISVSKTNSSVFLPKEDVEIYPIVYDKLADHIFKQAFSFFDGQTNLKKFIYHKTTLHKFADWIKHAGENIVVSVDPSIEARSLGFDDQGFEVAPLHLSSGDLKSYLNKVKIKAPKAPSLPTHHNLTRLFLLLVIVIGMPFYLFFFSLWFIHLGKFAIDNNNQNLAKFSFNASGALATTNSQVLGLAVGSDNALYKGVRASQSASKIGKSVQKHDYLSLFKQLSFFEIDPNIQDSWFSSLVKSVNLTDKSREKILSIAQAETIKSDLLAEKQETSYAVVETKDNLVKSVSIIVVDDSEVIEKNTFSVADIDDRIQGFIEPPQEISDYYPDDSFSFEYVAISPDTSKNAESAHWFVRTAFDREINVVVFVNELDMAIPDAYSVEFAEDVFYGFLEGNLKAWSPNKRINSVLLDLNRLSSV